MLILSAMPNTQSLATVATVAAVILSSTFSGDARTLSNREVLVLYNSANPESIRLAEAYQKARAVPANQVIGLKIPIKADITRADYEDFIVKPLRETFTEKGWWRRERDSQGLLLPTENSIRAIVLMRGVPLRIQPTPVKPEEGIKAPADPIASRDEASVDSELAMFGIESLPAKGVLKNAFFESAEPLSETKFPFFILTARIDAPTYATCKRMINDAMETENHGLWGRAYVDVANKFPEGDKWLNKVISQNMGVGIPTVTDRFNDTLPKNYPMTQASVYYGWYDGNVSGPFLNPTFMFRPGAVAVHLHSFSADQLTDPHKNWCAPLLVRGAAATVGNVYEPYLHLTHHFDIMHDRLLKGWSFAEAAWASMPVTSWQGVALGDPLYRPFLHLDGTGDKRAEDRDFRAIRAAMRQWPEETEERRKKLADAAANLKSGDLAENLALEYMEQNNTANARLWLAKAKEFHITKEDKLRQDIQLIAIDRAAKNNPAAISALRNATAEYGALAETEALSGWLDILDPPPPPVADPTKLPKQ
jgi:uncharacterized protein (TIGR03790 family)